MCGICGLVQWHGGVDPGVVEGMAVRLAHRGPDGKGLWRDPGGCAAFGHRRLAVLDLTPRSAQPMVGHGGRVLTYNGEVYGFRSLRRELEREGVVFSSSGDTEVVLAALANWGDKGLHRLDGMFALALWDPADRLLLARDRFGIKPLFWAQVPGGVVFASELPALLVCPGVSRQLNREALGRWLQLGYLPGSETLLKGVRKLEPGSRLIATPEGVTVQRWYDPLAAAAGRGPQTRGEALDLLEGVVREAVGRRLVADVPLGCFLSSGVDSSLVAAFAGEETPLESLTVRFEGGDDESQAALTSARLLGLEGRVTMLGASAMEALLPTWARVVGDPFADPSLAPSLAVSEVARQRWKVALSGDGGDELFSGYPRLRAMRWLQPLLNIPRGVRRLASGLPFPPRRGFEKLRAALRCSQVVEAYQALQGLWPPWLTAELLGDGDVPDPWPGQLLDRVEQLPPWIRWRALDLVSFLPERVLAKVDRASMAHGLEVRVPLLDHRVVEAALSLPEHLTRNKSILRELLYRKAPLVRIPRRKLGFEVPLAAWLRGPLREEISRVVEGGGIEKLGLDPEPARRALDAHLAGTNDTAEPLFALWVVESWYREIAGIDRE